ncbi:MAG: flagellar protein FlaG [Pseudomonadota bacterium]
MSDKDVSAVSGATGSFTALRPTANATDTTGKSRSAGGKSLPPAATPNLETLTAKLNLVSETIGRDLRFQVDMTSGRSVIQVLDRDTGEIIRQIPPEEAQLTLTRNGFVELKLYDESA